HAPGNRLGDRKASGAEVHRPVAVLQVIRSRKAMPPLFVIYEPKKSGWISCHYGICRNIAGDDASGPNYGVFTNCHVGQNSTSGTDAGSIFDQGGFDFPVRFRLKPARLIDRPRVSIVYENNSMANEDVVFYGHPFADEGMARNLAVLADRGIFLDLDKRAYPGIVANLTAIEVYELRELDVFTKPHIIGDAKKAHR